MSVQIKSKLLEGRPHFVVPVVMGVEGVWNGSGGPLLYTEEELRKSVQHWNGRPAVVYHPSMNHNFCAGNPEVFDRQRVGTVFNARYDAKAKALKAEVWLDPERLAEVDKRVLAAVRAGKVMEVSTGLFTENEHASGSYQGSAYHAVARNHRPDHLAILPDEMGACSVKMGAGLCRNGVEPVEDEVEFEIDVESVDIDDEYAFADVEPLLLPDLNLVSNRRTRHGQ